MRKDELRCWEWEGEILSINEETYETTDPDFKTTTPSPSSPEDSPTTFMTIRIEINEILSSEFTTLLLNGPMTHRPLLCLEGTKKYDGLWSVYNLDTSTNSFLCFASHQTKQTCDVLWNEEYHLHKMNSLQSTDSNIQLLTGKSIELAKPRIYLAPPLVWHCLVNIFNIVAIDTVNQTFHVDFYAELRLKYVANHEDKDAILKLLECYRTPLAAIDFLNVSEPISEMEVWTSMGSNLPGELFDFIVKIRFKAIFIERMELEDFPFDLQDLNIPLTFNSSIYRVTLRPNLKFPSVFQVYFNPSLLCDLYVLSIHSLCLGE